MIQTTMAFRPNLILPSAAAPGLAPSLVGDRLTLSGASLGETVKSIAVCGTVLGAPALLGAAGGWLGAGAGLLGVAAMVRLGVHNSSDRGILMPLALLTGGIAGVAGVLCGWPGGYVAAGLGAAYGFLCR